ncbi:MAG: hypothetical protein QG629_819 [Patescibacteria group bacterium]|nr:hypothetical protein [Patescibacteria group bacterium]
MAEQHPSSFRDPAGFIFTEKDVVYRQINKAGKADYDQLMASGLYDALVERDLLVTHTEVKAPKPTGKDGYTVIRPATIPFISYPYEWSFSQLKDAALLTLRIQKIALKYGMVLKDASAYNIQFIGKKPVLIDTLSFMPYVEGEPWEGYKQFCEHFLAPLALASYTSLDALKFLRSDLEGISLQLTTKLLPRRARLKPGLLSHIYLHSNAQEKYKNIASDEPGKEVPMRKVSRFALEGLVSSLEQTVRKLKPPKQQTEWGDYYTFTNYSDAGFEKKRAMVREFLEAVSPAPTMVWDIGANNGEFSSLAAEKDIHTVAFDIDPLAVERNYLNREVKSHTENMLPLLQDVINPSPANGLMGMERASMQQRGPADVVMALALIHHLSIGRNLPFERLAEMLAGIGKHILIEFVPKEDSKVRILLTTRRDVFPDYNEADFEKAMSTYFTLVKSQRIDGTKRTLYLFKRK